MVVSMTAVGPVGMTGGLALLVVLGASGSAWDAVGGGVCGGGVVCGVCASAGATENAAASARKRSVMRGVAPTLVQETGYRRRRAGAICCIEVDGDGLSTAMLFTDAAHLLWRLSQLAGRDTASETDCRRCAFLHRVA